MEENIQEILSNEDENVVQFNFENNTSSPVAITLLNSASLTTIPTSGNLQTSFSASNDLFPTLPPSLFALNPNNGTFIASDLTSPVLRLLNTNTNTIENNFDNSIGFNGSVTSISIQPDGKILCGGGFTTYKGVTENYIIRLNSDGSKDMSFDNAIGFNNFVSKISIQPDGKIICGGLFTTYKGVSANRIIRLNSDGSIDTSFDYGTGFNGAVDGEINILTDGKILCGGFFTTYKGVSANYIIRLNPDGSIDTSFDYGTGFNSTTDSIKLQSDGKLIVVGQFTQYKGLTNNRIIRLNTDGSKDNSFDNSVGFNNIVSALSIQSDGKILCGGLFTQYKGLTNNRLIRLNSNGSKDTSFDNSVGFNSDVLSMQIQTDGKILVGGQFTTYKGITNNRIIRLNPNGSKDTSFDNSVGFNIGIGVITIENDSKIFLGGAFATYKGYTNNRIIKLNSDGGSASTLNVPILINSIEYNSVNNKFYAEYSSGIYVISSDAQTIEAQVSF